VNKQERTYTIVRDRINAGEFAPGMKLNIEALSRELGVSPIPVREALRRLEAEGRVRFRPNVGAIVSPADATSWEQAMATLAVLEGAASADAQRHLRKSDFARIRRIAAEMEEVAARSDPLRFNALNRQLHAAIVARCTNTYLLELLEQTHARLDRVRATMFVYLPERSNEALREHAQLITLLEDASPAEVERYARWHKLQVIEAYRAVLQASDKALAARRQAARSASVAAPREPLLRQPASQRSSTP
jgi:DNA-binding GntR family transcriptional regulator